MTFYNREGELDILASAFDTPGSDCVVVYGRQRVGKTELLKQFCADRPHVYFLAAQEAEHRQREKFVHTVADFFGDRVPQIDGWDEALGYLGDATQREDEDIVVVIDEFPYLVEANESLQSHLQRFVDETLSQTDSMLILCGSSVSTMDYNAAKNIGLRYLRRNQTGDDGGAPVGVRLNSAGPPVPHTMRTGAARP